MWGAPCSAWAGPWPGLACPAFRRDVISVHPLARIVSGAHVPSMGKVGWEAGARPSPQGPLLRVPPGRRAPARAVASNLTRYLGMLGCGRTGTMTAGHPFSAHGFHIYSTRRYLGGCSRLRPAHMHLLGGEGGLGEEEKQAPHNSAAGERHGNKKAAQARSRLGAPHGVPREGINETLTACQGPRGRSYHISDPERET